MRTAKTILFSAALGALALAFGSQVTLADDTKKDEAVIKSSETKPAELMKMKCPKCKKVTTVTPNHDHGAVSHDHGGQQQSNSTADSGKSAQHEGFHKCKKCCTELVNCCDTKSASAKETKK